MPPPLFISDDRALRHFCETLRGETILAFDTEFISESTYAPQLQLVQIATRRGVIAVIDYGTIGRLDDDPLAPVLRDASVLKLFHSAHEDLLLLARIAGEPLAGIWDTQLVTRLFGHVGGDGYGKVVESLIGEQVAASQALTDWSKRPLTPQQLHYAAEDVRYLIPICDKERQILGDLGRHTWAEEECARLTSKIAALMAARSQESTVYSAVHGAQGLDRRTLAILRELAIWRDRAARAIDRPAGSVMKDAVLVQIARRAPKDKNELNGMRGVVARDIAAFSLDIVQAIQRGKRIPAAECPPLLAPAPLLTDEEEALAVLLSAVVEHLAAKHGLPPSLIGKPGDLQRLVDLHRHGNGEPSQLLTGWRRDLAGRYLVSVIDGNTTVRWDANTGAVVLDPVISSESACAP